MCCSKRCPTICFWANFNKSQNIVFKIKSKQYFAWLIGRRYKFSFQIKLLTHTESRDITITLNSEGKKKAKITTCLVLSKVFIIKIVFITLHTILFGTPLTSIRMFCDGTYVHILSVYVCENVCVCVWMIYCCRRTLGINSAPLSPISIKYPTPSTQKEWKKSTQFFLCFLHMRDSFKLSFNFFGLVLWRNKHSF